MNTPDKPPAKTYCDVTPSEETVVFAEPDKPEASIRSDRVVALEDMR